MGRNPKPYTLNGFRVSWASGLQSIQGFGLRGLKGKGLEVKGSRLRVYWAFVKDLI